MVFLSMAKCWLSVTIVMGFPGVVPPFMFSLSKVVRLNWLPKKTPSYWHGWNPNNKEVAYVAQRNGVNIYNIYKKLIKGGEEVALTNNKEGEHVDGCEYSPDGKWIYYKWQPVGNHADMAYETRWDRKRTNNVR